MISRNTLIDCLIAACDARPEHVVYSLLGDGEQETDKRTNAALLARVTVIARHLRERGLRSKTALLLVRDPLRFIEAFWGCLWAGVIAVPAAVPRKDQTSRVLLPICDNAQVAAVITDIADAVDSLPALPTLKADAYLHVDDLITGTAQTDVPATAADDIAFLQYTSGSTGYPKGVVVTHGNLMANQEALRRSLNLHHETVLVSWLPLYHDMGLIGHALPPVYLNAHCVLMSPSAFLQRPVRWLSAISRYRGTNSGGANFAYDLCVTRISPAAREGLDLASWEAAYNGGEPVRLETIERFCTHFASSGFRRAAMYPCYGLAEGTLVVTGNRLGAGPQTLQVSKSQLARGQAIPGRDGPADTVSLVSSGVPAGSARVIIVDPTTCTALDDGCVGEIWTSSESVCAGYFRQRSESLSQFVACLADSSHRTFLRTGDLGFRMNRQLYVTGRLKDVILIRGHNHYPQDLEATASRCNPDLTPGMAAAVAIERPDGSTEVCLICELTRRGWLHAEASVVAADVREAIASQHGLTVSRIVLIRPGTLPRTSSGKVRRSACRDLLLSGQLHSLDRASTVSRTHETDLL